MRSIRSLTNARFSAMVFCLVSSLQVAGQCDPFWEPVGLGMDDYVHALAVHDDGSGLALYAGGKFGRAGFIGVDGIARWNGRSWTEVGEGIDGIVYAMTVFDDGSGPGLYAGGKFNTASGANVRYVAKWDGTSWLPLGDGLDNPLRTMAVFDDGSGAALYVGGEFTMAGGVNTAYIAKWDGSTWTEVGGGTDRDVLALETFDDGSGQALFVAGTFSMVGDEAASKIAKWDGTTWSALGTGCDSNVRALTVFDDGSEPALYAGGAFVAAGGTSASKVARWNGTTWSPLGIGLNNTSFGASALCVFDDGSVPALFAAGDFSTAGGVSAVNIAEWDGSKWWPLNTGLERTAVLALTVFDNGSGPALFAGGEFDSAGGTSADRIARWRVPSPDILKHPLDLTVEVRETATFSVRAVSLAGEKDIQWRRDGVPLADVPQRISGTRSHTLRIDPVAMDDLGLYDATIKNDCGLATTMPARLDVTCYPDCDDSTGLGTIDIFDFLCFQSKFVSGSPYACGCDTSTGPGICDVFDFLCFQSAISVGCE